MNTYTLLILTDFDTFRVKVEPSLKSTDFIKEYTFTKFKDNVLLKVKTTKIIPIGKVKRIMYNLGIYTKKKQSILTKLLFLI